jgi:hypothetical protein
MNIFVLDWDVKKCAEYHNDKHVVKMILELLNFFVGYIISLTRIILISPINYHIKTTHVLYGYVKV